MDKDRLAVLASDPTHIKHLALMLAGNWLAGEAAHIAEVEMANSATEDDDEDMFDAFYDPVKSAIEQVSNELLAQSKEIEKDCIHTRANN
jgi:hypothetical protein